MFETLGDGHINGIVISLSSLYMHLRPLGLFRGRAPSDLLDNAAFSPGSVEPL